MPHVYIPALSIEYLFDDAFSSISEACAATLAVGIRLQKALLSLSGLGQGCFKAAARLQSRLALDRARHALPLVEDVARLERLADVLP